LTDNIADIIRLSIEENPQAQAKLYSLYAGKMYAVCKRYAGNTEEAKDILQDGFMKVFSNLKSYGFKGSFEGWVRKIIVNTALGRFRTHKLNAESIEEIPDTYVEEEERSSEMISPAKLTEIIENLPPQYRMVFNLYAIDGHSHKEIAELLNITESTSKSNLSRARHILQLKIKGLIHLESII
jgi:RNA polymerase sigma factor (sigma-70 family)